MVVLASPRPAISEKYFEFFNEQKLVDCLLIAGSNLVKAHKIVLSSCSSYFQEIFDLIPDKEPALILGNVSQSEIIQLMQFVYCGRVSLEPHEEAGFRRVLAMLRIEFVTELDEDDDDGKVKEEMEVTEVPPALSTFHAAPVKVDRSIKKRVKVNSVVKDPAARQFMDENPLLCPFCMKSSTLTKHRNEHVKYCTRNPDRIDSLCPHCDKNFCDPFYVRKHIRAVHKIDVSLVCIREKKFQ